MSWLVTARTHTEIINAAAEVLQETARTTAIWGSAERIQTVKDALPVISKYVPYRVKDESLTFASATRELDISSVKDIIRIRKAEWIVDKEPPNYRNFEWIDQHTIKIGIEALPSSGDYCYLYIDKQHHLDPIWVVATAYVKGDIVSPTKANRSGYRYECTTAGTSHATTEPTWPTTAAGTVVDQGVTWTCRAEVPNSLKDGDTDIEALFIELLVAMSLDNKSLKHINKVNVGSARALEQYMAASNKRLALVIPRLRAAGKPNTKQWYPTA